MMHAKNKNIYFSSLWASLNGWNFIPKLHHKPSVDSICLILYDTLFYEFFKFIKATHKLFMHIFFFYDHATLYAWQIPFSTPEEHMT
jgi:hypothetical protein